MSAMLLFVTYLFTTNVIATASSSPFSPYLEGEDDGQWTVYDEIIEQSNSFGYDLMYKLYKDPFVSIWLCPFCITSNLALLYPGSGGMTQLQIGNYSGYPLDYNASVIPQLFFNLQISFEESHDGKRSNLYDNIPSIIKLANRVFISNKVNTKASYMAAVTGITGEVFVESAFDFTSKNATKIINEWMRKETNGLIDGVLDDEEQDITDWKLAAFNSMYLNGTFEAAFDPEMTSLNKFYRNGLRDIEMKYEVHLMHQIGYFKYYEGAYYQFLRVDLTDHGLFLLYVLPINPDLNHPEDQNGMIHHGALIKHALNKLSRQYVAVAVPKLSINCTYNLDQELPGLGIKNAFDPNLADFTKMTPGSVFVDKMIHKTMIVMDEYGFMSGDRSYEPDAAAMHSESTPPALFKADHPFQIFIIDGDHDNTILFMGQVNNPGIPQQDLWNANYTPPYDESMDPIWNNFSLIHKEEKGPDNAAFIHSFIVSLLFVFSVTLFIL